MINETERTVIVSAEYFAELFVKAKTNGKLYDELRKECDELKAANEDLKNIVVSDTERKHFAKLEDEYIAVSKECDELKKRLADESAKAVDYKVAYENAVETAMQSNARIDELVEIRSSEIIKERDELKAKLDGDATVNGLSPATQKLLETEKRLAAAERCIEEIEKVDDMPYVVHDIIRAWRENDIIRAWRENKEAK